MQNKFIKRSLVIIISIFFFGTSILPSISSNNKIEYKETNTINTISVPVYFTENIGQFSSDVLFQAQTKDSVIYLCKDKIITVFSRPEKNDNDLREVISIVAEFVDANSDVKIYGKNVLSHHNNYFIGDDPDKWYTNVPNYGTVYYENIHKDIDLKFYSEDKTLKYDFYVEPGADPSVINIKYKGIERLILNPSGDLEIKNDFAKIIENKPIIYQNINGIKEEIKGRYKIYKPDVFGFILDEQYNPSYQLVIDPTLTYSTYLGGTNYDIGRDIAVDGNGNAYVVGETGSNDYPTQNPYQGTYMGLTDAFVTKLAYSGSSLIYSTYFGGTSHDYGAGIDVDNSGNAYITGTTYSSDFPTHNPIFPNLHGVQDAFVAKFNSNGGIMYSTYLGGSTWEWGMDIEVDNNGVSYITGFTDSSDFPVFNAYDSTFNGVIDFFVSKLDPPGGLLMFSTYLGGSLSDIGMGIDIDNNGNAYLTGYTWSSNFPVTPVTAYDSSYNGGADICIAIVDTIAGGSGSLVYGSYIFGQGDDFGYDIVIDNNNIMYVTGETASTVNQYFPTTSNAYQQYLNGARDAFFFKLDSSLLPSNQMLYCSYLGGMTGGNGNDAGQGIDLDSNNNAYITGLTECSDFPLVNSLHTYKGGNEVFVSLFDPTAIGTASLIDSTYIGGTNHDEGYGIAVDNGDNTYVTGLTYSTDFLLKNPYQAVNNGLGDGFVTKIKASWINNPPNQPTTPSGPTRGKVGISYPYQTSAVDTEGHKVKFGWDWDGDSTVDYWADNHGAYYNSGEIIMTNNSWSAKGTYNIKVMAEDIHGAQSIWSNSLTVIIPRNRAAISPIILRILNQFPNLFKVIRMLIDIY